MTALRKFIDPLPLVPTLKPKYKDEDGTHYDVRMRQVLHQFHSELKEATVWGYEGIYPGPVIEVQKNEPVWIKWLNELPEKHFLPVDKTLHGVGDAPEVRTVVHLHGARVEDDSDGYPEAWYTRGFAQRGPFFTRRTYFYPNQQRACTLWYHDHALGITRLNVYAGLAGFYLIRDKSECVLGLPEGPYEIPLLIQDRSFNPDGSLFYPSQPAPPLGPVPGVNPSITPGFLGDTIVVNGKVWPYLEVEPRKYRFRVLNGSNDRFYRLSLSSGQPMHQIGTDGGLLEYPVDVYQLIMAPAERVDLIIDFSKHQGKEIVMLNDAANPFPNGAPVDPETTGQVMMFKVTKPLSCKDHSVIPDYLYPLPYPQPKRAKVQRYLPLVVTRDQYGRLLFELDGKMWHDPVTEKPRLGEYEIWNIINPGLGAHPIHLHLIEFQILERQPFDIAIYNQTGQLKYTGPAVPPDLNEQGLKDMARANPGMVTRFLVRFEPYTGRYVWHCHILEHEDYDMMRPLQVVDRDYPESPVQPPTPFVPPDPGGHIDH
ncbi:spore coat protein A [Hydrogenispora ethanolica]|jgi:spore coat protein A|uniref:Spore coat protein A n=1 Tax=Hydrogenispora ethanolica TaxID=1082276 RepID=A0A4R1RII0_HYDET|nr:multicopper oxidase [Hydrogenispora ethanolica]TCL65908.1 spore coat protein A [Hydrogenispora ethanolica]